MVASNYCQSTQVHPKKLTISQFSEYDIVMNIVKNIGKHYVYQNIGSWQSGSRSGVYFSLEST